MYMESRKKWYWWTYLQGSNRDTNIEKRLADPVGEGEGGTNWESSIETYTLPYVKQKLKCDLQGESEIYIS